MTQYVINIGAVPDDGTGDPLRTAFNETNLNFDQVFAAGPVLSNIQIANNKILTTNTNGNLVLAPNGTGVVQSNVSIVPNAANIRNLGSATNRWNTVYTQYLDVSANLNIAGNIVYNGDLNVAGNLTVQGNIIQVGNIVTETLTIQLANAASTANAANGAGITVGATDNIATLLYNSTGNVWTTNIGLSSVGNISAPYFIGNGSQLTGLAATYGNANVVTLLAGFGSNTVSTTGNITGGFILGNGSQLTGLGATYSNANVVTLLAAYGSNTVSSTGNITTTANISGGFILGNVAFANGFPATYANANAVAYGESGWAGNIIPSGNAVYSLGNATNQWNDLYVSNATIFMNNVPISLGAGNVLTVGGNAVLQNNSNSSISTTGNITANYFFGNGSQLTGLSTSSISNGLSNVAIPTANGNVTVTANAASTWTFSTDSTLTLPAGSSRITSYGQITIETDNNASGMYLNADGVNLLYANTNVTLRANSIGTNKDWNFGNTGNLILPRGGIVYETSIPGGVLSGNTIALKPQGGIDADQQLLIYPTVIPGTDDNHLHLTTGNLYNTELFLGNDDLYVKLANTGNVVVNSNDDTGNTAQWTFGANGNLTLPGGSKIVDTPTGVLISGAGQIAVNRFYTKLSNTLYEAVDAGVTYRIIDQGLWSIDVVGEDNPRYTSTDLITWANAGGGLPAPTGTIINGSANVTVSGNTWTFGSTGNLTLPGNIIAINYANGNRVTGGVTFNGEAVIGTGTSNTQSGLYLAPDPVSLTNDLYLRVRGNIIDEPTHIHFDTGNNQYFNQFIGDDNKYIQLANTGNVVVNTNDNAGNSAQWIFNNFGTLSLPGGSRLSPLGANLDIFANGGYVNLITADESSRMGVSGAGGFITTAGGTWQFGTTGNLTAPGNISAVGNVTAGNISAGSGTITGGNVNGANFNGNVAFGTGTVGGSGNITGGNILTAGIVSATGNVSGNFFIGNGSQLTGIAASYGNANVATFLAAYGSNTVSTTGNITGNYFIGNGSQLTGISGNIANITANVISFNTAAGINVAAGQMAWNSSDGTLDIGLSYADVVLQVGQETHYVVRNDTGNIIENGTAVYCSGVTAGSGRIEASLMTGSTDPVKFLGLATQDISNGVNGVITYFGYVRGLDTRGTANTAISVGDETWAVGDQLYVHPTAAGKLTNVEPAAPNVKICVASILIRNQTTGVLFVRPTTNLDMVDLSDVQITTPAANQFLVYAGNRWENTALDISLDTTPTLGGNLAGAGFNVSNVGNISATGNITAQNFTGNINITGNVQGTSSNVTLVAGAYSTVFDNTGNATFANGTVSLTTLSATANITGGNILTGGLISATGNVSGNFFVGNGSLLTGLAASYGNANVVANLAALGSNPISTTGNITGGNIMGGANVNATTHTGTTVSVTGNITGGNLVGSALTATRVPFVGTGGALIDNAIMYVDLPNNLLYVGSGGAYIGGTGGFGTVNATRLEGGTVSATGNVTGGNIRTAGLISATGNATAGNVLTGGLISATGNVSGGNLNVTGNIVDSGALSIITGSNGNIVLAPNGTGIVTASGAVSAVGNVTGGNILTGGLISATGNITAGNLSVTGNVIGTIGFTGASITINNAPGGNEGAEIQWALPSPANTVLNTSLVQDVFQNGMRFFESGGNSRGLYMDLGNVPNGAGTAVGYRDIPQVSFAGNTTIATTDAGRHYYSTQSTSYTLTIANNASQGFQVGAAITVVNQGTGNITVAQGSGVTLYLAGNATSGNRTIATFGMATLIKVATNTWFINGTGVS